MDKIYQNIILLYIYYFLSVIQIKFDLFHSKLRLVTCVRACVCVCVYNTDFFNI